MQETRSLAELGVEGGYLRRDFTHGGSREWRCACNTLPPPLAHHQKRVWQRLGSLVQEMLRMSWCLSPQSDVGASLHRQKAVATYPWSYVPRPVMLRAGSVAVRGSSTRTRQMPKMPLERSSRPTRLPGRTGFATVYRYTLFLTTNPYVFWRAKVDHFSFFVPMDATNTRRQTQRHTNWHAASKAKHIPRVPRRGVTKVARQARPGRVAGRYGGPVRWYVPGTRSNNPPDDFVS